MTKSSVLKVIGISAGVVSLVAGGAGVGFAISSVANKDIKGDTNVISLDTSASYLQNTTGHQSLTISSKLNDKPSTIITLTSDDTTYTTLDKTTNTLALKVGIDIPHEAPDVTITASAKNAIDQHVKITLKSNDPIPDVWTFTGPGSIESDNTTGITITQTKNGTPTTELTVSVSNNTFVKISDDQTKLVWVDDERPTDDNTSVTVFGKLDNFIKGQFNVTLIAPKSEYASFELSKHTLDVNPTLTTPDSVTLTLTLINFPTYPTQDKIIFNGEEDLSLQFNDDWTQNGILWTCNYNVTKGTQTDLDDLNIGCTIDIAPTPIPIATHFLSVINTSATVPVPDSLLKWKGTIGTSPVMGFSDTVVATPSLLAKYNTLNLYGKTIGAGCKFSSNVFDNWMCKNINLGNTKWEFYNYSTDGGNHYASGYQTFMNCNLDFVSSLNLEGADFANSTLLPSATDCTGNCHTGFSTFEGAEFDDLLTLSLKDCNFACAGMAPATTTNCGVGITARRTFYASNLENVASLDLSNCTFAVAHMDSGQQTQTATLTFGSADLSKCQTINWTGAKFAASDMQTNNNISALIGAGTFDNCDFSNMNTLSLTDLVFAVPRMTTSGFVCCGAGFFNNAYFEGLATLDVSGATYCCADASDTGNVRTAENMFSSADLSNVATIDMSKAIFNVVGSNSTNSNLNIAFEIFGRNDTSQNIKLNNVRNIYLPTTTTTPLQSFAIPWDRPFDFTTAGWNSGTITLHNYASKPAFLTQAFPSNFTWSAT